MSKQDTQTQNAESRDKKTIESDIHETRYRLDQTLTALEDKLSPQYLMNETFDYFRYGGPAQFTGNLGDSVKNNPVPFLLTAVGLSWLMLAPRSGPTHHDIVDTATSTSGHGQSSTGQSTTGQSSSGRSTLDATKDKLATTRDKASSASDGVRDSARGMKESMSSGSAQVRDGTRSAARNASTQTVNFVENNPLAAAGIGIGIGLALGALFPSSRFENEQMGEMRDDLVDKASDAGIEQADKLNSKVDEKAEQTKPDSSKSTGHSPSSATGPSTSAGVSSRGGDSPNRDERTSQAEVPASNPSENEPVTKGRSTSTEPAKRDGAPLPGARQTPGERGY